ncbi:MAG: metal-dependent transcriptional regulator [Brooklawnia sp.]|nr:metal-dependent transcriptional regulator [Brooklawnia sp.]
MSELIDTTEMYLRTILELHEEGIEPLRARIVERLHQSGPTVSQTVARLERDGLLEVQHNRRIELSDLGWERARKVMRKHRLAERMLSDIVGMEWTVVHDEACKLEHVIGDVLEHRLTELMDSPQESPYGCPIPDRQGALHPERFREGVIALAEVVGPETRSFRLMRLSEFVQADAAALAGLDAIGLRPGITIEAVVVGDSVEVRGPEGRVRIEPAVAAGLWVAADQEG